LTGSALFRLGGLLLESALPLDDLVPPLSPPLGVARPDLSISLAPARALEPLIDTIHAVEIDGEPSYALARDGAGWRIRTYDEVDFLVDAAGTAVTCLPGADLAPETLAQIFVDRVLPVVHDLRGATVLHASAVALEGVGAGAFVGRRGRGKSTLAAALCLPSSGPPLQLLADDSVVLETSDAGCRAHPAYAFVRLCQDAAEALDPEQASRPRQTVKCRVARPAAASEPLLCVYVLEPGDGPPAIEPRRLRDGVAALAEHVQRLDPTDRRRLAGELARLERIARHARVVTLRYPRGFDALPAVCELVRGDLAQSSSARRAAP
jgi:hypothetical protein